MLAMAVGRSQQLLQTRKPCIVSGMVVSHRRESFACLACLSDQSAGSRHPLEIGCHYTTPYPHLSFRDAVDLCWVCQKR